MAAIYGTGDVSANHGDATLGGVSSSSYRINVWGGLAEAGYRFRAGDWRITSKAGFDWTRVETGAFTEVGGFALAAVDHGVHRTRAFVGVDVGRDWLLNTMLLSANVYGRVVDVFDGRDRLLPVTFAAFPSAPLTIQGVSERQYGADVGAKLALQITRTAQLWAKYDGRFRDGYEAHTASGGLRITW